MLNRRTLLFTGVAVASGSAFPALARGLQYGTEAGFSFDGLIRRARDLAGKPYEAPTVLDESILHPINYDAWGAVRFNTDSALFAKGPGRFPVTFFPLGRYFREPTRLFVVSGDKEQKTRQSL